MSLRRKLTWIAILYFAEGLPFGIAYDLWPVYFRRHGVSLREIGLLSLLSLPWTWKLVWAPLVDRWGARQHWITAALAALGATTLAIVPLDPAHPSWWLWVVLLAFTTASATQDIAVDAYTVDLVTPESRGPINGMRVSAARAAFVLGGGVALAIAGLLGWQALWVVLAMVFFALAPIAFASPRVQLDPAQRRNPVRPVLRWLFRKEMVPVLLFVPLYKLGDSTLGRMVKPFWVDRGYSDAEIGLVSMTGGVALTIVGALAGGWFVKRYGIFRALLWLGIAQSAVNLGYVAVASLPLPRESLYVASLLESFGQGLGTAAFISFLTDLCDKEHAATQYALLSALFALTRDVAGAFTGIGVEKLGYATYFAFTIVIAVPALTLLPWIKRYIRENASAANA
jgi:PAT family beta-lactamase induction signal transducer AmpG